ncbi:hypothetical protein N7478_005917 [Penicillium angulare]|uniref:uncharacterized protein n=1 Tax=Penicillium angulare TaxID=116970 RepID=UPI00253FAD9A|nr:uncharacterized protein N7478_005917 [Penicillium angulare]KAJ5280545.1 hypothetical protein N7478_005917 [Penicillium angulare]
MHAPVPTHGRSCGCENESKATHARLYPRHHNPNGFQPIAPRPSHSSKKSKPGESSSAQVSRSGSTSAASSSHTPTGEQTPSYRRSSAVGAGYWSGSEGSGNDSTTRTLSAGLLSTTSCSSTGVSGERDHDRLARSAANLCPSDLDLDPVVTGDMFDPLYSLLPTSSSSVSAAYAQAPLISPLESANPFDFPLDPALGVDRGPLGYLEDMDVDVTEGLVEELFHVEDWSRYMWSPETGFEHLDMGFPPVTR